ncbi:unnamed protein product [Phyllotreta striolata]|uniref:non-specific serine/threonine protein kinase n=1 Tax=Phyllotreta striolata TaxID=444603 RepID=A0A9N9TFR7_PHYSR|nr:unnamed protein product [Phyllotreta striolata]
MSKYSKAKKWEKCPPKLSKISVYQMGKVIGKGTYSKVCLAVHTVTQKKFACKIISKKASADDYYIQKFLPRELKIISRVQHPNIVTFYNVINTPNNVYVLMDYCKHGDLLEFIRERGPFDENKTRLLFGQVAEAVHYLHCSNIAHRDIKCENIFLVSSKRVKLGDFGFARYCVDDGGDKVLSNTFCGSAAYAAPEVLRGEFYDPKKYDIWAMGCIVFVMITASTPFDDSDVRKMVKDQMSRNLRNFEYFWEWCSVELKRLLFALLEPDKKARINSFQVLNHPWLKSDTWGSRPLVSVSDSVLI